MEDDTGKVRNSMERLTQTSDRGGVALTFDLDITCEPSEIKKILKLAEKLKDYEDAEEQGRYIKLPAEAEEMKYRECVHTRTKCHHENCKCSECPLTELFCDEFFTAIDRCYEDAYARGCLAGIELGKAEAEDLQDRERKGYGE